MEIWKLVNDMRKLDKEIEDRLLKITELKCSIGCRGISYGERVQGSHEHDKMADVMSEVIELENEVDFMVDRLVEIKRTFIERADRLDNPLERDVVIKLYPENKSPEMTATECERSVRQIFRIRKKAMKKLEQMS